MWTVSLTRFLNPMCRWTWCWYNSLAGHKVQRWSQWGHLKPVLQCPSHTWHSPPSGRKPVSQQHFLFGTMTRMIKRQNVFLREASFLFKTAVPKSLKDSVVAATPRSIWSRSITIQRNFLLQTKISQLERVFFKCFRWSTYLSISASPLTGAHERNSFRRESRVE